ncbi:MAG: MFS transporter, partial [Armatimonadota bacterium]|nr:MFS transporter [Armatimonadota bacterium]
MQSSEGTKARRWYEGVTGYHWLVLAVACFGWLFDTMDQWLYVFSRQPALRELLARQNIEPTDANVSYYSGIVQAIFIFGWATGGFLFGIIGDRLGRTRTMAITVLMYAGFTGL